VKYLLDTHTLLWIVHNDPKLSSKAKSLYLDSNNEILFSAVGIWELAIKISLNKLSIEEPLGYFVQNHIIGNDIKILDIEIKHILLLENLLFHHRDPFDRMLIAQAMIDKIPIITSDRMFDGYNVQRIW
jgi:PIN domain nuclease of toxin-antitoxin system